MMARILYNSFRLFFTLKAWFLKRFTKGGLLVFTCLAATAIVGVDTRQTVVYQAFVFLLLLLTAGMVSSLIFQSRLEVTRFLPRFGTAGEKTRYRVRVKNNGKKAQEGLFLKENFEDPRPTFDEFYHTPEPYEKKRNPFDRAFKYYRWLWLISTKQNASTIKIEIPSLSPNDEIDLTIEINPSRRGELVLTGFTLSRPCPFGLFNAVKTLPARESLLVLPKRYQIPDVGLSGARRYQSGGVALASSVGDSEEFISMRDYRPGDPLRKIHWKSWAKIDKPVVKEFQDEFFVRHALVLDTFQKEAFSKHFEEAVSVAASYTCSIQTQESLLDLMFVGPKAYCFTAGRGLANTARMLEILASVTPCRDKTFSYLTPVVMNRAPLLSGCICILLSWDEEREKLINLLKALGIPMLVLVITDEKIKQSFDPDQIKGQIEEFHVLQVGKIAEGLAGL